AVLAGVLLIAVGGATGQTQKIERGKRVVADALKALGGDSFLEVKDRVETGRAYSFYREQLAGLARATIYTRYLRRPQPPPEPPRLFMRERQAFGKDQDYSILFDEERGFQITFRGARPVPAEMFERFRESTLRNVFYILRMRLREPGMITESQGTDVLDNQPVEVVDFIDGSNTTVTVYFHYSTKLPVKQVTYRRNPKTRERHEEVTHFSKYRDVGGGVMWPMTIQRFRDGEKIFEIYSESVTINQDLSDIHFTLPGDMKVLPPAR
ncbi:MAG: hypothetical protein ACRD44_16835, partial [Bryobacteraceae bacterium]